MAAQQTVQLAQLRPGRTISLDELLSSLEGVKHHGVPAASETHGNDGASSLRGSQFGKTDGGLSRLTSRSGGQSVRSQRMADIRQTAHRAAAATLKPGTIAYDSGAAARAAAAAEAVARAQQRSQSHAIRDRSATRSPASSRADDELSEHGSARDIGATSDRGSLYGGGWPGGVTPRSNHGSVYGHGATPRSTSSRAQWPSSASDRSGSQWTNKPRQTPRQVSRQRRASREQMPRPRNPVAARLPSPSGRRGGPSPSHVGYQAQDSLDERLKRAADDSLANLS